MIKSENMSKLSIALSKFQGEVKNPPNSANNPFFKSKYAPLDVVINTAKAPLAKYGLSYIQLPGCDGEYVTCVTILMFEDEFIESDIIKIKPLKMDVQGMGATITYVKRYQLSAMLGMASEEDKDGENVSGKGKKTDEEKSLEEQEKLSKKTIDKIKVATLESMLLKTNTDKTKYLEYYKLEKLEDMTNSVFEKAMKALGNKQGNSEPQVNLDI